MTYLSNNFQILLICLQQFYVWGNGRRNFLNAFHALESFAQKSLVERKKCKKNCRGRMGRGGSHRAVPDKMANYRFTRISKLKIYKKDSH